MSLVTPGSSVFPIYSEFWNCIKLHEDQNQALSWPQHNTTTIIIVTTIIIGIIMIIRDCYDTEEMALEQNQFRFKDFIDQQTGKVLDDEEVE